MITKQAFVDKEAENAVLKFVAIQGLYRRQDPIKDFRINDKFLFTGEHQLFFGFLLAYYNDHGTYDLSYLISSDEQQKVALTLKFANMEDMDPTDITHYESPIWKDKIEHLRKLKKARSLVDTANMIEQVGSAARNPEELAAQMMNALEPIATGSEDESQTPTEEFDRYLAVLRAGGTWQTGIKQLNRHGKFGGWYGVLASRSHHGKTAAFTTMMLNTLLNGDSVFMWQGESSKGQFLFRCVCALTGLSPRDVIDVPDERMANYIATARSMLDRWLDPSTKPVLWLYTGRQTVEWLWRRVLIARDKTGLGMTFLDQLSKFQRPKGSREETYSEISQFLWDNTLKYELPLILAHQLNIKSRFDGSSVPAYWQVKDCGRLYEDCDTWFTLDRPEVDTERIRQFDEERAKILERGGPDAEEQASILDVHGQVRIKVEKDRVGMIGLIEEWCRFNKTCGRIESISYFDRLCRTSAECTAIFNADEVEEKKKDVLEQATLTGGLNDEVF